jgi:hypothetical protein
MPRAGTNDVGRVRPTGGGGKASRGAGEGTGKCVGGAGDVERGVEILKTGFCAMRDDLSGCVGNWGLCSRMKSHWISV